MKFQDTTEEQRKHISPYLLRVFIKRKDFMNRLDFEMVDNVDYLIYGYKQAQKEHLKDIQKSHEEILTHIVRFKMGSNVRKYWENLLTEKAQKIKQLKFELRLK